MNNLLRLLEPDDAAAVCAYFRENCTFHEPWMPLRKPEFFTESYQRTLLEKSLLYRNEDREYRFGIFGEGEPAPCIGLISLVAIEWGPFCNGRLGYSMARDLCGNGIMTARLWDVVEFAFQGLHLHRLEANIIPRNHGSRRVLEKCGFSKIGYAPQLIKINGTWEDHEMYAILVDDYLERIRA